MVQRRMSVHSASSNGDDLVNAVEASLLGNASAAAAALEYFPLLSSESAIGLIPTLLRLALSVHGLTESARSCLARLPSDRVVEAAAAVETDVIRSGDHEEYACLFEIWRSLGHTERAMRLAERAGQDSNEDVRDVARSFLQAHRDKGELKVAAHGSADAQTVDVPLSTLLANPTAFDGKQVRLVGYVISEMEGWAVFNSENDRRHGGPKNGVWLDTYGTPFAQVHEAYAVVEGTYDATSCGHLGMWCGTIRNVMRVEPSAPRTREADPEK
jgi:hypothetical protein